MSDLQENRLASYVSCFALALSCEEKEVKAIKSVGFNGWILHYRVVISKNDNTRYIHHYTYRTHHKHFQMFASLNSDFKEVLPLRYYFFLQQKGDKSFTNVINQKGIIPLVARLSLCMNFSNPVFQDVLTEHEKMELICQLKDKGVNFDTL